MDKELIIRNELTNDLKSVHLYYNAQIDMWVSYGNSAYSLRLYVKDCGLDNLRGYSEEMQLPCTVVNGETVKVLRHSFKILDEQKNVYLKICMKHEFDMRDFLSWTTRVRAEYKAKECPEVKTLVSEFVPKDIFIPDKMSSWSRNSKRIFDCIAAFFALLFFSPLFLVCYLLVKKEDGGPAIFKQERIGRFGRPFYIYKFRSMRLDAEKLGPQLSHSGGEDDVRLTRIGRFLRAHHLDELPQLWNVFCGDMAFIGPRPERKFFIDQILEYDKRYVYLYQIRPGVTSFATLYNGYTDTMQKMLQRLEYDLYYLAHRSIWFDIKILFNTFSSIVLGKKF